MKTKPARPWWRLLKIDDLRAWWDESRKKNAEHNTKVQTRQVHRRTAFESAMQSINQQAGGESRSRRRRMARALSHRWWVAGADKRAAQREGTV